MTKHHPGHTRTIAVALAVLLILAQLLSSMPAAAQFTPPTLGVSPGNGLASSAVTLSGSGFTPGGYTGAILWDGTSVATFNIPAGGSFSVPFTIPADGAAGTHTIAVCASTTEGVCFTGEFEQKASATFKIELGLKNLPQGMQRRVAQFLEEMRNSPMAQNWNQARPSGLVRALYRPDLQDPAYYEVQIVAPPTTPQTSILIGLRPAGFIILSAGEHDFPIAHWSDNGEAPTRLLERQTKGDIAKFYKLDTLAYAAEGAKGDLMATLGSQPPKLVGLDQQWLTQQNSVAEDRWTPNQESKDDSNTSVISGTITSSGPKPPTSLKRENWASWAELKSGFQASYGVLMQDLQRQAKVDWDVENNAIKFGEGLRKGDIYNLALLTDNGASVALTAAPGVSLSGPGAAYVQGEMQTPSGQPSFYRITVIDSVAGQALPMDATINYTDGTTEVVKFVILGPAQAQAKVFVPMVSGGGSAVATREQESGAAQLQGAWGPWTYFWAGNGGDQRLYNQIPSGSSPNTSGCWSGCGATAWAMLFGWADNQAALGNPYWAPRKGLYRENGGYGADAVAPATMDTGIRSIIWEIRNRVGTFCLFGSGATWPWDMKNASGYLAGRTGAWLRTNYNVFGIHSDDLREKARDSIRNRQTPAIIGTGWLNHYPLAFGYAWRSRENRSCFGPDLGFNCWTSTEYSRWFYVNQGWGGSGNGWVSAGTWFAGELYP